MSASLLILACISGCTWMTAPAAAQNSLSISAMAIKHAALAAGESTAASIEPAAELDRHERGTLLTMYVASVATQMLDAHSTLVAVDGGAIDANPVVRGMVQNPAAFLGVKAAIGVGVAYATHKIARRNRTAGIVASIAINSACLMMAAHNYRTAF